MSEWQAIYGNCCTDYAVQAVKPSNDLYGDASAPPVLCRGRAPVSRSRRETATRCSAGDEKSLVPLRLSGRLCLSLSLFYSRRPLAARHRSRPHPQHSAPPPPSPPLPTLDPSGHCHCHGLGAPLHRQRRLQTTLNFSSRPPAAFGFPLLHHVSSFSPLHPSSPLTARPSTVDGLSRACLLACCSSVSFLKLILVALSFAQPAAAHPFIISIPRLHSATHARSIDPSIHLSLRGLLRCHGSCNRRLRL